MQPAIDLKKKLASGDVVVGALMTNHLWPEVVEVAIAAGLDYLIADAEHMGHSHEVLVEVCRMGRLANFPVLLRPQRTDRESIGIAMDLGPCGFLLPLVESAEQLDGVRDGAYLPPRGRRRPGGAGNRWISEYRYTTFRQGVEDDLIVLPQIENGVGLENVREIAEHELTTAVAVGPFDLSVDLGVSDDRDSPIHAEALATIRRAAADAGKPPWMIGDAEALVALGYRFVCGGEVTMLLQAALRDMAQRARRA